MPQRPSLPPKPVSEIWRPELVRLPPRTLGRRLFRRCARWIVRLIVSLWLRPQVSGLENLPSQGPALIVINHLGDVDGLVIFSLLPPIEFDALAKIELRNIRFVGWFLETYGVIWVHRGRPDRRAISAALEGLRRGGFVALAPEGRESLTGALEQGTAGAAFLALKADAPIVPIVITGTQNERFFAALKRLRRIPVTVTVGKPFRLEAAGDRRAALRRGTDRIMQRLAQLLPPEYRGVHTSLPASPARESHPSGVS